MLPLFCIVLRAAHSASHACGDDLQAVWWYKLRYWISDPSFMRPKCVIICKSLHLLASHIL